MRQRMRPRNSYRSLRARYLRALWRDTRALVHQFRVSLLAFAILLRQGYGVTGYGESSA